MGDSWAYEQGGRLYPRVTRILDCIKNPGLEAWRDRIGYAEADKVAAKAAKIGQRCHKAINETLAGHKVKPPTGEAARAFETWRKWYGTCEGSFKPSRVEQTLFGMAPFDWAGTPDAIEDGMVCSRNRITDWKFAGAIEPLHWVQCHAYAALAWPGLVREYMTNPATLDNGIRLRIVRIDPFLGIFEERERAFDPAIMGTFMALAKVYRDWFFEPAIAAEKQRLMAATD